MGEPQFGFDPSVAVPFFEAKATTFVLNADPIIILNNDPQRVYYKIFFETGVAVATAFLQPFSGGPNAAFFTMSNTQPEEQWWAKSGAYTVMELYAHSSVAGTRITVLEVRYDPRISRS